MRRVSLALMGFLLYACASGPAQQATPIHDPSEPDVYHISEKVRDTDYICMGIGAIQNCATAKEVRMFLLSLRAKP